MSDVQSKLYELNISVSILVALANLANTTHLDDETLALFMRSYKT